MFTRRNLLWLCLSIWLFVMAAPFSLARTQTKFFPIEEVRPGLKGVGYTVFSGTKISSFDVTVLSMVESNLGKGQLILVRLSGKLLQENGGLSAGMSGSPVYIDKKLLGAISYGFENADPFLALVTPIDDMMKLTPLDTFSNHSLPSAAVPAGTPVMVSGMGQRAYEILYRSLGDHGLKAVMVPKVYGQSKRGEEPVKPGSAIAVQMVSGDYQVAAIGTVTWVDKQKFLAFGHSFANKGEVDYLALQAYILDTVKSPVMSFKIGVPLEPVGRIVQDRQAGIMGHLAELPRFIPVTVAVVDLDRKLSRTTNFQVNRNEQMFRDLICSGVMDTIDQTLDRVGGGTAKLKLNIQTNALAKPLLRENLYYGKDIALASLGDLRNILDILAANEFQATEVHSVKVDVEVKARQETARIIKLETEKEKFKPGESIALKAVLHTYRGSNLTVPLEVKLPDNLEPGKLSLTARGGAKDSNLEENDSVKNSRFKVDYKNVDSLEKLVKTYLDTPVNQQLVVEFTNNAKSGADKEPQTEQSKADTNYYIIGEAQLTIELLPR